MLLTQGLGPLVIFVASGNDTNSYFSAGWFIALSSGIMFQITGFMAISGVFEQVRGLSERAITSPKRMPRGVAIAFGGLFLSVVCFLLAPQPARRFQECVVDYPSDTATAATSFKELSGEAQRCQGSHAIRWGISGSMLFLTTSVVFWLSDAETQAPSDEGPVLQPTNE